MPRPEATGHRCSEVEDIEVFPWCCRDHLWVHVDLVPIEEKKERMFILGASNVGGPMWMVPSDHHG